MAVGERCDYWYGGHHSPARVLDHTGYVGTWRGRPSAPGCGYEDERVIYRVLKHVEDVIKRYCAGGQRY